MECVWKGGYAKKKKKKALIIKTVYQESSWEDALTQQLCTEHLPRENLRLPGFLKKTSIEFRARIK